MGGCRDDECFQLSYLVRALVHVLTKKYKLISVRHKLALLDAAEKNDVFE